MQTTFFNDITHHGLTIEQVAQRVNASTATVRNWIKTGYLTQVSKGVIAQESLDHFIAHVVGKEKLHTRANKLSKDRHDYEALEHRFEELYQQYESEDLGTQYEQLLSESHRNKEGIYYTPSWIVRDMLNHITIHPRSTFLDPCCGSGNFIIEAIRAGIAPESIYGFDSDEHAVAITKKRIYDECGVLTHNVIVADFLQEVPTLMKQGKKFDLIFTNPPWGKKLTQSYRQQYSALYGFGSNVDTTSLFLGASLAILQDAGTLGFLVQEALFNILAFKHIRRRILKKQIVRLVDYGKAFDGLVTKAYALILHNHPPAVTTQVECRHSGTTHYRVQESFKNNPNGIFDFWSNEADAQVIDRLYSTPHTTLHGKARWALGIVTGNNKKHCKEYQSPGYIPLYKGSDITKQGLKDPSTFVASDLKSFQQVAPLTLYQAPEKLIYRFISSDLCFYYDNQQRFILNSANLLIPHDLGISPKQLTCLLNSEILNWLFKKLFATHKVLRGDLELLPIHTDYFKEYSHFSEATYLQYLQLTKANNGTFRIKT